MIFYNSVCNLFRIEKHIKIAVNTKYFLAQAQKIKNKNFSFKFVEIITIFQ